MADTIDDSRVKDVPVSASACNADDWFLIDGETSGTRKLSATNIQKKLTSANAGINISISTAGVIDVKNQNGYATNYSVALGTGCSAIGRWAFAHGYNTFVSGANSYSHAEGSTTTAYGNNSHAEGNRTLVSADNAHGEGSGTSAIGGMSHSEGYATVAYGQVSHAEGTNTSARGYGSHSEGRETLASAERSHVEGYQTTAGAGYSHAEGFATFANGQYSHAEGNQNTAAYSWSHVEGSHTISDTSYQHVEGQYNAPATGALHVIGNGSANDARSNIVETYSDRVVVNGDLINDTKDATMTQFMFDNYNYPTTSTNYGKLLTKNTMCYSTSPYMVNQYTVGNYTLNVMRGLTGTNMVNPIAPSGNIIDWEGNVGGVLQSRYDSQWRPLSWPTDKLPRNTYNTYNNLYWTDFARYNALLTELPSGWYNSMTAYVAESGCFLYGVRGMFSYCTNLSGNVKPWIDFVLSQSGTGQAGAADRVFYRQGMFVGCTGVDNYSTLTADPTYSAFFAAT